MLMDYPARTMASSDLILSSISQGKSLALNGQVWRVGVDR
jgi:hypothetical protein